MAKEKTVNDRIGEVMVSRGITNQELAAKIGKHVTTIDRIVSSLTTPTYGTVKSIAEALNCSVEYLLKGAGGPDAVSSTENPYKDYSIKRLEREVEKQEEENSRLWEMITKFMNGEINFLTPVGKTG